MLLFKAILVARPQDRVLTPVKGEHKMMIRGFSLASLCLCAGATVLMMAGAAGAAEPQPWQLGLQPPAGSILSLIHI